MVGRTVIWDPAEFETLRGLFLKKCFSVKGARGRCFYWSVPLAVAELELTCRRILVTAAILHEEGAGAEAVRHPELETASERCARLVRIPDRMRNVRVLSACRKLQVRKWTRLDPVTRLFEDSIFAGSLPMMSSECRKLPMCRFPVPKFLLEKGKAAERNAGP